MIFQRYFVFESRHVGAFGERGVLFRAINDWTTNGKKKWNENN